jgi:hypothetical protein
MAALGIAITRSCVRAVLVRGKHIVWHASVPVEGGEIVEALDALLATMPPRRGVAAMRPPRAVLAIGIGYAQVKRIDGLPATRNQRMLTEAVRQNSTAFFLAGAAPLVISDVDHRVDGSNWAAAYHADTVDGMIVVLRRRGMPQQQVVPSIVARAALLGAGSRVHVDDGRCLAIEASERGVVTGVRRVSDEPITDVALPPPLAGLGADYLDAYAATMMVSMMKLSWRPPPDPRRARRADVFRFIRAALLFAAASVAALIGPGVRAGRDAARATVAIDRGRRLVGEAARVEGELARVSAQLDRVEKFQESRGKITMLVGAIARSIPDSTALVTLRVDSVEGSFVALTPHAADVLPELAAIDGIVNPRIAGSVTREMQGAARLERATVRFRRPRNDVRPVSPRPTPAVKSK